jgi:hypothetical protein
VLIGEVRFFIGHPPNILTIPAFIAFYIFSTDMVVMQSFGTIKDTDSNGRSIGNGQMIDEWYDKYNRTIEAERKKYVRFLYLLEESSIISIHCSSIYRIDLSSAIGIIYHNQHLEGSTSIFLAVQWMATVL